VKQASNFAFFFDPRSGQMKSLGFKQKALLIAILIPFLLILIPLVGLFLLKNFKLLKRTRSFSRMPEGRISPYEKPFIIDVDVAERRLPPRS